MMRASPLPHLAWLSVWLSVLPVLLFAAPPDPAANLSACKNGWSSCERSRLTPVELAVVTLAERARNLSICRSGLSSCDQSQLTEAEAITREAGTLINYTLVILCF